MILVVVGTQLPFDRMVSAVDEWAGRSGADVLAQVGPTKRNYPHVRRRDFLDPAEFDEALDAARLLVAHAGMGSILSALCRGKPMILMPRRVALGEHRNDHQLSTARKFCDHPGVRVAWDERELGELLPRHEELLSGGGRCISDQAPAPFLQALRAIIDQ